LATILLLTSASCALFGDLVEEINKGRRTIDDGYKDALKPVRRGSVASESGMKESRVEGLPEQEVSQESALLFEAPNPVPFEIGHSLFLFDGKAVFLNIIGYQPLEPGQDIWGEIHESRIMDDLRRWRAYQGGSDPIVLRIYPQPTVGYPYRLPKVFYDGARELGFWIIRDIYFDQNFCDPNFIYNGHRAIDAVIAEVNDANALDLIFAWEIGNEFIKNRTFCWDANVIKQFIENMCSYLKAKIEQLGVNDVSNWVTWASYPPYDPLFSDGNPLEPNCLDYISYNAYSYHPERIRDHQAGPVTGTPYQGYLAALKKRYPNKPLVISETGLSDSVGSYGDRLYPWYPTYRYGCMSPEQVAEGLADRYWDARLLRDESDPNIIISGMAIFAWNDEWWKGGSAEVDDQLPEEHFGLGRFIERPNQNGYQLRFKFQQETIQELYSLKFENQVNIIDDVAADDNTLPIDGKTWVNAVISDSAAKPVRLRWETNRGYLIGNPNCEVDPNNLGEPNSVEFYPGNVAIGPATITVVAIDANNNIDTSSVIIDINTTDPNIEILTFATYTASGRVADINLDKYKLVVYVKTNKFYAQPKQDKSSPTGKGMKSIWINKDGYWWTPVTNEYNGELYCWLVDKDWSPPDTIEPWEQLPEYITEANTVDMNSIYYKDTDNDLLPDFWEERCFGNINRYDRYDDPDGDMGNNLEEFLREMDPNDPNDDDEDGLWDNWEYHYFGDINLFDANDDPDGDGLTNLEEQDPNLGTHPGRASQDRDQDGLPDLWEIRWFGNCDANAHDNLDGDCLDNLDEYELSLDPTISTGDFNCDWTVDIYDLSVFQSAWLSDPDEANWKPVCDISEPNDNFINFLDFAILSKNWLLEL
jgi:hypothetical protein